MVLFYIAGYVIRKDDDSNNDVLLNDTNFYNQKYSDFVLDSSAQEAFFCYVIFNTWKEKICRKSLCSMFMLFYEICCFNMSKRCRSNIFLKHCCLYTSP